MSHGVLAWGRFNPPTEEGHGKLVKTVQDHAEKVGGQHYIFPTHTQEKKKNPLSHGDKVSAMRRLFPTANVVSHKGVRTIIDAMKHMEAKGHTHVTVVAGSDRVGQYSDMLNKYRSKEYPKIKKVHVVSAGQRDPDAEGAEGMSASKLRGLVADGKKKEFMKHYSDKKLGAELHDKIKAGMQMESVSPVGIFLLGAPGSGKDYVLKNIFSRFDLTEVQAEHILNGAAQSLIDEGKNIVINGSLDNFKIEEIKTILENYATDFVYVSVTNKVSRLRNALRDNPLAESKRIDKFLKAEKLAESYECFRFNNSINLNESSEFERVFFADQIEKLLERIIGHNLIMTENTELKSFVIQEKANPTKGKLKGVCWPGYTAVGMKMKNGRRVPNCVPVKEEITGHLTVPHTVDEIAAKHNVSVAVIVQALAVGKQVEMEHTEDEKTAETIVLTHLWEKPDYYEQLQKIEQFTGDVQGKLSQYAGAQTARKIGRQREVAHFRDVHRREREAHKIAVAKEEVVNEDLRKWFDQKWVRMDTKGEIKGDCAREEGEGKPKCLPLAKARAMDKDDRAKAVRRKRRKDPVADRKGKGNDPVFVKTEEVEYIEEKNVPTNPSLWSKAKSLAKSKFDVYPSAYANGWASKWYKSKGGGWKSVSEEIELDEMQLFGTDSYRKHAISMTPGQKQDIDDAFKTNKKTIPEEDCGCGGDCGCNEETNQNGTTSSESVREASEKNSNVDTTPTLQTKKKQTGSGSLIRGYHSRLAGLSVVSNLSLPEETIPGRKILSQVKTIKLQNEDQQLQEAIKFHLENKISFTENVFRPGSEMFFEMIKEAKRLYSEGKYTPEDEYEVDLLNSDIGEKVIFEGQEVMLDYPFEEDEVLSEEDKTGGKGIGKPWREGGGGAVYVRSGDGIKKVRFSQSGMAKKFNDPARVRSFVARHRCLTNKDKTSASYWACRWPRYFSNSGKVWW